MQRTEIKPSEFHSVPTAWMYSQILLWMCTVIVSSILYYYYYLLFLRTLVRENSNLGNFRRNMPALLGRVSINLYNDIQLNSLWITPPTTTRVRHTQIESTSYWKLVYTAPNLATSSALSFGTLLCRGDQRKHKLFSQRSFVGSHRPKLICSHIVNIVYIVKL